MPAGGAEARGNQLEVISKISHEWSTSQEMGKLLEDLGEYAKQLDQDSDDARLIKVAKRDYDFDTRIPVEFVGEFAQATTMAFSAWVEARQKSDFSIFLPHLQKVVDLNRRMADFFPEADHPYDVLLDQYEPGMKTAEVKAIFEGLRPQQVELIKKIAEKPEIDDSFLHQAFDEQKQWDFGVDVVTRFGYDWNRGRQDKAPHPFSINFGMDDVRITTRVYPDFLIRCCSVPCMKPVMPCMNRVSLRL